MSAVVCGKRSSFFEDIPSSSSSSPPVSKRIRCSSSSPVRFSPPRAAAAPVNLLSSSSLLHHLSPIDHLAALFPDMDTQLLERALEERGNDLDSTIKSLNELRLGSTEILGSVAGKSEAAQEEFQTRGSVTTNGEDGPAENPSAPQNVHMDGADWVELFVREMMSASNMDDARTRASRALEFLEKSICSRASAEAAQGLQQENVMLKEQLQALIQENTLLKRAVSIQHERQKEFEDKSQELHNLKQMVSQYQEQLRTLEINNYSLTVHLKQAQRSNSIPGRFHPDVF
ncbi:hypothetical protein RJ639_032032 [Escallonia herrerae]|uniref:CUE domain-containing protein n=1 Tax=Escallonia herrerae TaxID=1293975 RepID=A0AA89BEG6_9ASTE|nr:hypothetical protein RJ639_032032 [Escallonia herrerae]